MAKLTGIQRRALTFIEDAPGKSGAFWRDLSVSPTTISNLENAGLVGALWRPATGETSILRRSWHITDAGRAALAEER